MRKDELMKKYKMQICIAAAVVLLGAAVFCGFQIYHHYAQVEEQTEAFEQMAKLVRKLQKKQSQRIRLSVRAKMSLRNTGSCICKMRIWSVGFPLPARSSTIL